MRNLLTVSGGLLLLVACESGPNAAKEPPVLKVTSPARSLIQGHAGQITVSGTVEPNANGDAIDKVLVNNVQAKLEADGSFHALIDLREGATLIQTVARDAAGTTASDTRAVQAGVLRAVGANIPSAVSAAMSADAFARLSAAAGPIIKGLDMHAMLAPLQPMVHADDPNGEDCLFARLFVDDLKFSDVKIAISPLQGGLDFRAEIDQLDVPAHARYAALCIHGSNTVRVTADRIVVAGTLTVTPNGMSGFNSKLVNPSVTVTNPHVAISGAIGDALSLINIDAAIPFIVSKGAEIAMNPLMNQALGALGGPQQLDVLGKKLDMQVAPSAVSFTPAGALVSMNMKALLAGSSASPGFIFTDNGDPAMNPGYGFQLALADDLINELMAEFQAIGMLDLAMPTQAPAFDTAQLHMSLPPMISADASDGKMRLVLGDIIATFTRAGTPVARAAINARVDLKIAPVANGNIVALQLGAPDIHVDTLGDIANATTLDDKDLSTAVAGSLGAQLAAISTLLGAIPVPAVAGLQIHNLAIASDNGYVMLSGQFQ